MLELKNIKKDYYTQDETVHALKDVSITFRDSEFVSVLGPSGCGKTTLLNIIGGLDRYTSGDLIIDGKSTKDFTDKDWDAYRNHSVGFVFQSYNLIPHLTVLQNVELSLTLSGVSAAERKERAIAVLKKVGLENKINATPNRLSGGQMQRVAIARALINDPEIVLADEPTGALDSATGIAVMDLLKEISKERLIIMVTHNPELAEKYSTRTVKLSDGEIISDDAPANVEETGNSASTSERGKKGKKKTSMSFFTALSLSFKNLMTKKTRTFLVSFAGSIGIIGIALILSLSSGFQTYIDRVQEDTLSSYPVTIERDTVDYTTLLAEMRTSDSSSLARYPDDEKVTTNSSLTELMDFYTSSAGENDLESFKYYLENTDIDREKISSVKYTYDFKFRVYGHSDIYDRDNVLMRSVGKALSDLFADLPAGQYSSMMGGSMLLTSSWAEAIDSEVLLKNQYDMLKGRWEDFYTSSGEAFPALLVVDEYNTIPDYALSALGLMDENEMLYEVISAMRGEDMNDLLGVEKIPEDKKAKRSYTFDELMGREFSVLAEPYLYEQSEEDISKWKKQAAEGEFAAAQIENHSRKVKIVGIVRLKDGASAGALTANIVYNKSLTNALLDDVKNAPVSRYAASHDDLDKTTKSEVESWTKLASISIYASSFENKDYITSLIDAYNADEENAEIKYTDYIAVLLSSVTTIINAISYVLIGFVSISLVVSSIMIGIITYISVLERTKEIGVLRALGASKKDVSRVFNAETLIIGFSAGALGILITVLLDIPISAVIYALASIKNVAVLPVGGAIALVVISMILTLIAGIIPSRIASKKDPVVALRTE